MPVVHFPGGDYFRFRSMALAMRFPVIVPKISMLVHVMYSMVFDLSHRFP